MQLCVTVVTAVSNISYKYQEVSYSLSLAAAPAEAPAPVPPLFTADKAIVQAPAEKKSPPPVLAAAPPFCSFGEPIHPSGIVVEIVGTEMSCQGRSCEEHDNCGKVLKEGRCGASP